MCNLRQVSLNTTAHRTNVTECTLQHTGQTSLKTFKDESHTVNHAYLPMLAQEWRDFLDCSMGQRFPWTFPYPANSHIPSSEWHLKHLTWGLMLLAVSLRFKCERQAHGLLLLERRCRAYTAVMMPCDCGVSQCILIHHTCVYQPRCTHQ